MAPDLQGSAAMVNLVLFHRLTLVVAAAGWGKSTLLRRMAEAVPSFEFSRPPAGWTPFSLAHALSDAISSRFAHPVTDPLPAYPTADTQHRRDQMGALAANVCALAADVIDVDTIVVIDDVDVPAGDPLEQFLEALVLCLPPKLHLVVACRAQPAMRIARLRAAGEVARISQTELALGEGLDGVDLTDVDPGALPALVEIVRVTGGWPLAVHLAAEVSRRTGPIDGAALVHRLLAPNAVLLDYLAEDVLAGLSEPERELLSLAGHVPELSPELLLRIGRDDLSPPLARLASDRIFLEPVTSLSGGVPSEHAAATLLGGTFIRKVLPPPSIEQLHRTVNALVELGDIAQALVLCVRVANPELALSVLLAIDRPDQLSAPVTLAEVLTIAERGGAHPHVAELRGDVHNVSGAWDEALAAYSTAAELGDGNSTRLARKQAGILYLRGRLNEADDVCAAVSAGAGPPGEQARVLATRAVIRWQRGDADGCEQFVVPAEQLAARAHDDAASAAVFTSMAMLAALRGDLPANRRHYQRALDHALRAGDVAQTVRIRTNRGSRFTSEGDYVEALAELDEAIRLGELAGFDTFSSLAHCNRGEALLLTGRIDAALTETRRAHANWTRVGSERALYAQLQLGQIQLLRGQRSEAISIFEEAVRLARTQGDSQGQSAGLVGLAGALQSDNPDGAADAAQRAIDIANAVWLPRAYIAAASAALRQGNRETALRRVTDAIELANKRRDRPALGEALLVRAAIERPPSAAIAEESKRLWQDLGNPIGEARAVLLIAATASGQRRDDMIAGAEQLLYDAGALGPLAEVRRGPGSRGVTSAIEISTLGGFRVSRNGESVDVGEWGSRKARDLVKLLVARRGAPVVRDEVAEMLWPDDSDRSSRRLSVLLSTVRNVFDPDKSQPPDHYVATDHDTAWLVRDHVDIDVEQFLSEAAEGRRLLSAGDTRKAARTLTDAASRYLGEFCSDDPYADWAAGLRELAKHTFVDTSFELAGLADASGQHSEAIRNWLRILDVDPYDEDAHLGLIRSLLAQRRHGEARRAYRAYCGKLAELDVEASPFPELVAAGERGGASGEAHDRWT